MSQIGKIRVNKGLYGKKTRPYNNAKLQQRKELFQVPMIDFDDIKRKIELVLHVPNLYQKLGISDVRERGIIIIGNEPKDIEEGYVIDHMGTIFIVGGSFHDRKIVNGVIISDLKMLLAQCHEKMRKRALEVLNEKP